MRNMLSLNANRDFCEQKFFFIGYSFFFESYKGLFKNRKKKTEKVLTVKRAVLLVGNDARYRDC